jgi:leader peptidase (prepilin peptidase) / N-methyltransferase
MQWFSAGDIALAALLGLLIGSFLNVVVHRLPQMMEQQWDAECAQHQAAQTGKEYIPIPPAVTLCRPRSRCPHCGHAIAWYENIPVLSWLCLRGRCKQCHQRISVRYPLVEITTAVLFGWCVYRWGWNAQGWAWCGFSAALLTLALIDWDTTYLPDAINLPLLWTGLIATALDWTGVTLQQSLWGAVAGYLSLWSIYWAFKLATGKEGMGYGDFKLFAALGAWFGWQALVPIILMASVIGAIIGIAMKLRSTLREGGYIPFGPFLAGAGFAAMLVGPAHILGAFLGALGV